jgi:ATP-dependent Clp protease protease subunit
MKKKVLRKKLTYIICLYGLTTLTSVQATKDDVEATATQTAVTETATTASNLLIERLKNLKENNGEFVDPQTEKHQKALLKLQQEKEKLVLENELEEERSRCELAKLTAEKDRILLENELKSAQQSQSLAELLAEKERLELVNAINEQKTMLAEIEIERRKLALHNALQEEKNKQQELKIQLETAKLGFEMAKIEFEKVKRTGKIEELSEKIAERAQKAEWDSEVNEPQKYLEEPFVNGQLIVSDRRIYLDGPIYPGIANYLSERINYFNNKDSSPPIFIIIDRCAGGSVMEGAKILKAMKTSQAPVYVVVKSLAASMGAVITTLADRSFAYPDAIILHHQVWGASVGNLREQEETLEMTKEWSRRLIEPVADKMGITAAEFTKKMYEHSADGNWSEFADEAVDYKWIDHIINGIIDTSFKKQPSEEESEENLLRRLIFSQEEQADAHGQRYIKLPPLESLDFYYLYNPNNYYHY